MTARIRDTIGVYSVKIGIDVPKLDDQMKGLFNLEKHTNIFTALGSSLNDVRVVVSDTFAISQQGNYPKLFIPFDCTAQELQEYLESETVPERYQRVLKDRQELMKQLHQEMIHDQYGLYDNYEDEDEEDDDEYADEGDGEGDDDEYHDSY